MKNQLGVSFSWQVKEELAKCMAGSGHCRAAELMAIKTFSSKELSEDKEPPKDIFLNENELSVRKFFTILKKTDNIRKDMFNLANIERTCCKRAFLRGAFLCVGSISDPEKSNHLEFVCNDEESAELLKGYMAEFDVTAKTVRRKKYFVVYLKDGEEIVDLLNVMGAHVSLMEFENQRILKEISNSVNRRVNCETANIAKTVTASAKQVEDIILIRDTGGFQKLPQNLREMAQVRIDYPDASLKELGSYLDPPVGKSGVNHRLRRLSEIAEKLRS